MGLFALASAAGAQPVCVPNAIGVPGQSGPPAWWGGGSGPVGDPRWQGAMSYGFANDDAQVRALQYTEGAQKYLVLSFEVKADSGGSSGTSDYLWLGLWDPAAAKGNIIKVTRTLAVTNADGTYAAGNFSAEIRYRDSSTGGAWNLISALPPVTPWLQSDTLLGATCIAGPPALCTRWNIRMRVPIGNLAAPVSNPAAGLPIPDTFSMWYELHVEHAGPTIERYKWPETANSVVDLPLTFPDPTNATQWSAVSTGSGTCAGGVNLGYAQITTDNPGSTEISTVTPNVFHARPTNGTAAAILGDNVRARFRIANWGSVLFDSPEWVDINPSSPSCASATGSPVSVAPAGNFDLSCSWTLTANQQCEYRPDVHNTCSPMPPARNDHQCILVELSSTTGVLFSRASAWNNMDFVTASRIERRATVSIRGLTALPSSTARDVYLYVTTQNMPLAPKPSVDRAPSDQPNQPQPLQTLGTKAAERLKALASQGKLSLEQLSDQFPTYVVRVYYDTGERVMQGTSSLAVIAPMPSFGYYVAHDGDIAGWKHSLSAAGAVEISPGFYKIAVPNDGAAQVVTAIETVPVSAQPAPTPVPAVTTPSNPWWLWPLLAIVLLLLVWLLLRRSRP